MIILNNFYVRKKHSLKLLIDNWRGNNFFDRGRRCKMANSGQLQVLFVYLLVLCKQVCSSAQSSATFKLTASGMY